LNIEIKSQITNLKSQISNNKYITITEIPNNKHAPILGIWM